MPAEQETFVVVLQSTSSEFCTAFLFQGTYEEAYKLNHECFNLSIFLLAAEMKPMWTGYGQELLRVCDLQAVHAALMHATRSAFSLRRLHPIQRKRELESIQAMLSAELLEITPLTEEEMAQKRSH